MDINLMYKMLSEAFGIVIISSLIKDEFGNREWAVGPTRQTAKG